MKRTLSGLFAIIILASRCWAGVGLNDQFGISLWQDSNLWDDSYSELLRRLSLPPSKDSSMAMLSPDTKILGARAYSLHVYAQGDKITQVVIAFANKADMVNEVAAKHQGDQKYKPEDALVEVSEKWNALVKESKDSIVAKMQSVAGAPKSSGTALSWNWLNHLIELNEKDSSLSLSMTSTTSPLAPTAASPVYTNTQTKPNGDVVIQKIPPIDQGPRGFCAPAAWEKCLRYFGVKFNVYELAEIGGTQAGGTLQIKMVSNMIPVLQQKGYRVELLSAQAPSVATISSYIDKGIPIIWSMDAIDLDQWISFNKKRTETGFPREGAPSLHKLVPNEPVKGAHAITVIGYNRRNGEVALSDTRSAAPDFQEIWVPSEYVSSVALGERMIAIQPGAATSSSSADSNVAPISTDTMGRKRF